MLEVIDLVKDYKKFRAVDHLDLLIHPGEIVGLLGPNGAGKTTAMRCIASILKATSGSIRIAGFDLATQMKEAKSALAFVPELPSLYELLTVREHMRFVAMAFNSMPIYEARAEELLARYDLKEKENALVATLSKGMRQKLAVACALIHDAKVMLFDEPMIGIDPAGVAELKAEMFRARDAGTAILVSTHLLDNAERLCDRIIIMAKGRKLAEGTMTELREKLSMQGSSLEQLFLALTEGGGESAAVFDI